MIIHARTDTEWQSALEYFADARTMAAMDLLGLVVVDFDGPTRIITVRNKHDDDLFLRDFEKWLEEKEQEMSTYQ